MNNLQILNQQKTINSREVAEMLGKEHKYILRDIEGTEKVKGIIPTLLGANLHPAKYFIESSYKDGSGKTNKCYEVTKMGCEVLGNKQQGEKGILFTAKYVERFNEMEKAIQIIQDRYSREHQLLIKIHERNYTIEEWNCKRCYKFIEI